MPKQQVKVVIRTRPTPTFASKNLAIDANDSTIMVQIPKQETGGFVNNQQEQWKFKFDKILHNASQEEVFDYCARDVVKSVVDGYNGTIMCYGMTGAGKTFTMTGASTNYKYRGITPRALNSIFQEVGGRFDQQINVRVSFVEIYNELMFDMLSQQAPQEQSGTNLTIQDDAKGEIHVKGLSMIPCQNEEAALNCLFEGEQNRSTADNNVNKTSSRSHCIFTIHIESKSRVEQSEKVIHSKLHLVDLAGNERIKKSGATGLTQVEAAYINKSLSFLEQVVVSTCDKKRDHVPYRQSKLTNMLKNSIGGNCKTLMVANIWPENQNLDEIISTLRFATRMKQVHNEPIVNELQDPHLLVKRYQREIRDLKQELTMHDTLASKGRVQYDAYSPEQQYEQQIIAKKYLTGDLDDIEELNSMRQVKELMSQMRNLFRKRKQEQDDLLQGVDSGILDDPKNNTAEAIKRRNTLLGNDGVGDIEDMGQFGLGKAHRDSKPVHKIELSKEKEEEIQRMQQYTAELSEPDIDEEENQKHELEMLRLKNKKQKKRKPVDRQVAFLEFKELVEGKEIEQSIMQNRSDLKGKRLLVKELTDQTNKIKKEIDDIKSMLDVKLEQKKQSDINAKLAMDYGDDENATEQEIIDEEELALIKKAKEAKKRYRENFSMLKETKSEMNFISQGIDQSKSELVSQFEAWFEDTFDDGSLDDAISQSVHKKDHKSPNKKVVHHYSGNKEAENDEDDEQPNAQKEGQDVDPDALAFIRARKNVNDLTKARKEEKKIMK